jgi:hypothetical protein
MFYNLTVHLCCNYADGFISRSLINIKRLHSKISFVNRLDLILSQCYKSGYVSIVVDSSIFKL